MQSAATLLKPAALTYALNFASGIILKLQIEKFIKWTELIFFGYAKNRSNHF
jgi:hypothetical protein